MRMRLVLGTFIEIRTPDDSRSRPGYLTVFLDDCQRQAIFYSPDDGFSYLWVYYLRQGVSNFHLLHVRNVNSADILHAGFLMVKQRSAAAVDLQSQIAEG